MIDILHVITPVSRVPNLPRLADSLRRHLTGVPWKWWVVFDRAVPEIPIPPTDLPIGMWEYGPEAHSVGGYSLRNHALRSLTRGWLYLLDDDNLIHPQLVPTARLGLRYHPMAQWLLFRQVRADGTIYLRPHCPPRVNHVDAGQCIIRRDLTSFDGRSLNWLFPCHLAADGICYEQLARYVWPVCIDIEATYYNAIATERKR